MTSVSGQHLQDITDLLDSLRTAVLRLAEIELAEHQILKGHQTVDAAVSLAECFSMMDLSISGMEDAVATIAEATGEREKL